MAAALLAIYPAYLTLLFFLQVSTAAPGRVVLVVLYAFIGASVFGCMAARWRVWSLLLASTGFLVALFAFPVSTSFEILLYAGSATTFMIGLDRRPREPYTPVVQSPVKNEAEGEIAMPNGSDLEVLKYQLERDKFLWQKQSQEKDRSVINRHFGVIITTIVSVAAIVVSYVQLNISSTNAKAQLDNEKLKSDRQFYLEGAKFMLLYEKDLRTNDLERIRYFRDVLVSAFPPEMAAQIMTTMRDTAPTPGARGAWNEGLIRLQQKIQESRRLQAK